MTHTFATTNLVIEGNKLWAADFFGVNHPTVTPERVFALLQAPARLFYNWRDLTEWCLERRVVIEQAFQLGPELSDEERGARRPPEGFRYEIPKEFAEVDVRERPQHDKDEGQAMLIRKARDEFVALVTMARAWGLEVEIDVEGGEADDDELQIHVNVSRPF